MTMKLVMTRVVVTNLFRMSADIDWVLYEHIFFTVNLHVIAVVVDNAVFFVSWISVYGYILTKCKYDRFLSFPHFFYFFLFLAYFQLDKNMKPTSCISKKKRKENVNIQCKMVDYVVLQKMLQKYFE